MSKFTPGKWTPYDDGTVEIRVNDRIEHYYLDLIGIDKERLSANGRLIAAAPEMYYWLTYIALAPEMVGKLPNIVAGIRELIARIDGDVNVEKKESEP